MLYCVTGVPGACKTAYVVTQLDNLEKKNKINLKKNIAIFNHNKKYFDQYSDDFTYIDIEEGSGHLLKKSVKYLDKEYFDILGQEFDSLRPDDYYYKSVQYNEIIDRINDRGEKNDLQKFVPVRTIYTNIKNLKIDFVRSLVLDWRQCPDGSVVVIDEVQLCPPYNDNKNKADPIVQELTIHRHRGFDFYFITQSPSYLHPTIKELISCHLHVTRPYWRTPKIYQFGSLRAYPNTLVNKLNCETKFNFKPKDHIFKLYKSTSIDTSSKRTPKGLIGFAVFILFGLMIFFNGVMSGGGFLSHFFSDPVEQTSNNSKLTSNDTLEVSKQTSTSNESSSDQTISPVVNTVTYDITKPYDFDTSQYQYQITAVPQLSGCTLFDNQCTCYTQQMTKIDMSQKDCKRYLSGDKPFNPFLTNQTVGDVL